MVSGIRIDFFHKLFYSKESLNTLMLSRAKAPGAD